MGLAVGAKGRGAKRRRAGWTDSRAIAKPGYYRMSQALPQGSTAGLKGPSTCAF